MTDESASRSVLELRAATLLALVLSVLCAACPSVIPRPSDALTDADEILAKANQRMAGVQTLSVYARVWQGDMLTAVPVRMDLVAKRPASLYFAILDPTQNMLGALATDGETFTSFRRGEDICVKGPACAENVGRLLPLSLEPTAIVSVLMGGAPTLPAISKVVDWDQRAGAYSITLTTADGRVQKVWVTHGTWFTRRSRVVDAKGKLLLDLKFDDEQRVGEGAAGPMIPHKITLQVPGTKTGIIRIHYREVTVDDEELDDAAFQLTCPKGATERWLPCDGSGSGSGLHRSPESGARGQTSNRPQGLLRLDRVRVPRTSRSDRASERSDRAAGAKWAPLGEGGAPSGGGGGDCKRRDETSTTALHRIIYSGSGSGSAASKDAR